MRKIINTTPHVIRFQEFDEESSARGQIYEVPPCGTIISATGFETPVRIFKNCFLVRTEFMASKEVETALMKLEQENPDAFIIGSIIAAQAFPGRVFAMIPVPGLERVPPDQKIMRDDKFTTF